MIVVRCLWCLLVLLACGTTVLAVASYFRGYAAEWNRHAKSFSDYSSYIVGIESGRLMAVRISQSRDDDTFVFRTFEVSESDAGFFTGEGTYGLLGFRYAKLDFFGGLVEGIVIPAWVIVALLWLAVAVSVYRHRRRRRYGRAFEVLPPAISGSPDGQGAGQVAMQQGDSRTPPITDQ